ncbi:hypothetical protein OPKNFCMD_6238 [Methylobacterium crusticola]|uniref:Replication initiation protein RepC n=1 Tax=Methylobacterium crusticola TaxID=1697972 RepID=A0ABQ4R729_9HYPH|nr:plasmid replication protein RepC [Methylobacterium crusticola]GJD53463.1 hypothetical protein OPKNFCMD_6238 [Methylobacterium crusticola]
MTQLATTPFGRRPLSLAMVAAQATAKACPDDAVGHKWRIFRHLTEAKEVFGVSDRALAVLSALLTFHPDTALVPGADLVVFPSNRELAVRAHGPAPATLRRALGQLVEAGLILRRDSPNGKRYARRGEGGSIDQAFGFDLTPLVARAAEFEARAGEVRAAARARARLREEISLHRRDIAKTIEAGSASGLPGDWGRLAAAFTGTGGMPPRSADLARLEAVAASLRVLRLDVDKLLTDAIKSEESSPTESQVERHHQSSESEVLLESERTLRGRPVVPAAIPAAPALAPKAYPLGLVLQACPAIADYTRHGIATWRDLVAAAGVVRGMLGISPSTWDDAVAAMGEIEAAVTMAAILERAEAIRSPGGYLRRLTEMAVAGRYSLGPVLMALMRARPGGEGSARRRA